jgi:IS6 family transposase
VSDFKGRHFKGEIVLWAVRPYCRYGVSYRDLEQMMGERGVSVDHSTIYRWVQKYAPEIERRLRWQWRQPRSTSWRVDETYIKVRGQWAYLYRAVDKFGDTIDFYLSPTRNTAAAKRFLGKVLNGLKQWEVPHVVNTDKAPTYAAALAELKKEGKCPEDTIHRQAKYLNNVVEADHGKLKQLIRPVRGFKTLKTGLCHDQGLRGHACAAQRPSRSVQPHARYLRRGTPDRARLRSRCMRPDRSHRDLPRAASGRMNASIVSPRGTTPTSPQFATEPYLIPSGGLHPDVKTVRRGSGPDRSAHRSGLGFPRTACACVPPTCSSSRARY